MIDPDDGCRRHRAALLDFVDHGEVGPKTGPALAHLERCPHCMQMLDATALTIAALRRLGDDVARAEPRPDSWPALRARISEWRPAGVFSPLAGMAMAVALCVLLVAPIRLRGGLTSDALGLPTTSGPTGSAIIAIYTSSARRGADAANFRGSTGASPWSQPKILYPDGIRPVEKEVPSARETTRPAEPR